MNKIQKMEDIYQQAIVFYMFEVFVMIVTFCVCVLYVTCSWLTTGQIYYSHELINMSRIISVTCLVLIVMRFIKALRQLDKLTKEED